MPMAISNAGSNSLYVLTLGVLIFICDIAFFTLAAHHRCKLGGFHEISIGDVVNQLGVDAVQRFFNLCVGRLAYDGRDSELRQRQVGVKGFADVVILLCCVGQGEGVAEWYGGDAVFFVIIIGVIIIVFFTFFYIVFARFVCL